MKILARAVLIMEVLVMGFAGLLAYKGHGASVWIWAGAIAFFLIVAAGTLRTWLGWTLGSVLQIALIGYGIVATPLFFLGSLFAALWIAAIVVGRKGEAARAALLKAGETEGQ